VRKLGGRRGCNSYGWLAGLRDEGEGEGGRREARGERRG
jgi:hypothetical protein